MRRKTLFKLCGKMKKIYKYLITFAVGLLLTFFALLVKDVFHLTETVDLMKAFCDATFVAGVLLACAGGLVVASNGGVFDMLAYGVRMIFVVFKRNVTERKYKDFYEYREARKANKRSFAFLIVVGLVYIAVSMIFLALYYKYLPAGQ